MSETQGNEAIREKTRFRQKALFRQKARPNGKTRFEKNSNRAVCAWQCIVAAVFCIGP